VEFLAIGFPSGASATRVGVRQKRVTGLFGRKVLAREILILSQRGWVCPDFYRKIPRFTAFSAIHQKYLSNAFMSLTPLNFYRMHQLCELYYGTPHELVIDRAAFAF
jgi:hypothetical protein